MAIMMHVCVCVCVCAGAETGGNIPGLMLYSDTDHVFMALDPEWRIPGRINAAVGQTVA